jgi:hypothetical protein
MPYTPVESLASLKHLYQTYGKRLWGEFGFKDAFNLDRDWFADGWLAIDQGPIIAMIENHRTGLCWRMFMANPEIAPMLKAIGWQTTMISTPKPWRFALPVAIALTSEVAVCEPACRQFDSVAARTLDMAPSGNETDLRHATVVGPRRPRRT